MCPLRPATDHSLGRPLPHQLANRPRAPPPAPFGFVLADICGISPGFPGLFPTRGQVTHVLLTRTPLYSPGCPGFLVRLACVKRAASVDSEPGSNSRLILIESMIVSLELRVPANSTCASNQIFNDLCDRPGIRMEAKLAAGLESLFERRPPFPLLHGATAIRSRILGNSKELQEVNRRSSPPALLLLL